MEPLSLDTGPRREYGGAVFPLVGVPLVMKMPAGVHPMQLMNKMAKRTVVLDELILEKDGGFRKPGATKQYVPKRGIDCKWRIDASRDCVVIDFFKKGKLLPWRYDELRLIKSEVRPDAEFHVGGNLLEGSTYLAGIGTAGRFHWQYQLRVRDTANPDLLHSSALTSWHDGADLDVPYDPDFVSINSPSSSDGGPSSSDTTSGGRRNRLTTPPNSASRVKLPRSPLRTSVDAPSTPISPRQPIIRQVPHAAPESISNEFCHCLLSKCPLCVRRCCRRRRATGSANRAREMHVETSQAPKDGGVKSKLRSWRLRVGGGSDHGRETPSQINVVPLAPETRSMRCKLLNEELPMAQKENVDCDP